MKNVPRDAIEVRLKAGPPDLGALAELARDSIDRLIRKLECGLATATLEELYDPTPNVLILFRRAAGVRIKLCEQLFEGVLIEFPLSGLNDLPPNKESAKTPELTDVLLLVFLVTPIHASRSYFHSP